MSFADALTIRSQANRDGSGKLPWEDNDFFEENDAFIKSNCDVFKSAVAQENSQSLHESTLLQLEKNVKISPEEVAKFDDVGDKYTDSHRCFGKPCPKNEEGKEVLPEGIPGYSAKGIVNEAQRTSKTGSLV